MDAIGMKLAEAVLDWAGYDKVVSEKGWDGGETEAKWDEAKKKMVGLAREIVEAPHRLKDYRRNTLEMERTCKE